MGILSVLANVTALGAAEQVASQAGAQQLDAMIRCRTIADAAARLDCFDRNISALGQARDDKSMIVLDRRAVVKDKEQRFGLERTRGDVFGGGEGDRQTAVPKVETRISRAEQLPGAPGRWNLTLANGMLWQTLEDLSRKPALETPITLERSSLGGFRARIGTQSRSISVKRLR